MSADAKYRICSNVSTFSAKTTEVTKEIRTTEIRHKFFIEQRVGKIFKRWETVASSFEKTDAENNISYSEFYTYEEAEKYLMQKYGNNNNYVKRSGNIYEVTYPRFYY